MGGLIPTYFFGEIYSSKTYTECFNKFGKPVALIGGVSAFIFSIYENKNNRPTFTNDYEGQQRGQALINKTFNGLSIIA
ncbi:MAG: hypothetical protein MZV64_27085 [Ignavibacteriales bacterium]|nr:hypothetical protein [Ignavibacteriales bacterium]